MLKFAKFATFILLVVFMSCVKETVDPRMDNTIATSRTATGLKLEIRTSAGLTIYKTVGKVAASNASEGTFTLVTDPNTPNAVTYTATFVNVTNEAGHLRVITNPSYSPVTYLDKYTTTITPTSANALQVAINPGSVVTSVGSLVVDEEGDGL